MTNHLILLIFRNIVCLFLLTSMSTVLFADTASDQSVAGLGQVASNLLVPVEVASDLLSGTAIIIGLTCLFGALVRYMQHRVNPLAHPISTVLILFILGIILLCLPLIYKITESGVPSAVSLLTSF